MHDGLFQELVVGGRCNTVVVRRYLFLSESESFSAVLVCRDPVFEDYFIGALFLLRRVHLVLDYLFDQSFFLLMCQVLFL